MSTQGPKTITSGRQGPAVVVTMLLASVAMLVALIGSLVLHETGWDLNAPFVRGLIGVAVAFAGLAWIAWRRSGLRG